MSESDIRGERLKKLERLQEAGESAFPIATARDTSIEDFLASFDSRAEGGTTTTLAGRVMASRGQGGIMFAPLFDGTGRVQAVFQKAEMDEAVFMRFAETVDVGDFIEVTGTAFTTKRGERSLLVSAWKMLAKSMLPIPDSWFGLKDEEKILRERYLDMLVNPEVRSMVERRSKFWQTVRNFYIAR